MVDLRMCASTNPHPPAQRLKSSDARESQLQYPEAETFFHAHEHTMLICKLMQLLG